MKARAAIVVAAGAVVLGQLHALGDLAPVVVGLLIAAGIVALLRWRDRRIGQTLMEPAAFVGPLGVGWLLTMLLPVHSFSQRSSAEAATAVSLQPVLELVVFLMVGLVAAAAIRVLEPTLERSRPPAVLVLLPVWIVASSAWSATAPYALVRGGQMVTVVVLAWATAALGRRDPALVTAVVGFALRWLLRAVLVLVVLGVLFGGIYTNVTAGNAGRFTWIGAHPNGSGTALSAAIIVALATPRRVLRLPPLAVTAATAALLWALYANHSRTAWVATVAALAVAFALRAKLSPLVAWAGTPLLAAAILAVSELRGEAIWDYVLRDEGSSRLATGNGRLELWAIAFRSLDGAFDWLCGHGYGITRTLFLAEQPWAGDAHNSLLALLVGVGLVGVALLAVAVAQTVRNVFVTRLWRRSELGIVVVSLLVLVCVNGLTADVLAEPAIGFVLLNLVAAIALVERCRVTGGTGAGAEAPQRLRALDPTGTSHGR